MCTIKKHGLTHESLVLWGLLLLSNIETDQGYLGKRRACNNLLKTNKQTNKKIANHESTVKKANERSKLVLSRKLPEKYQISDSCLTLITRESCNSLIRMVPLKTQKSKIRPSAFFSLTKPYKYL